MIYEMNYQTKMYHDCLNGCFINYLDLYQIPIASEELFFAAHGMDLTYEFSTSKGIFLYGSILEKYRKVLCELGIPCEKRELGQEPEIIPSEMLKQLIISNVPVILSVASKELTYNSIFQRHRESGHYLNIIGFNETEEIIYVSDAYVPLGKPCTEQAWISSETILKAWEKQRYKILTLDLNPDTHRSFDKEKQEEWKKKVRECLKEQIGRYLDGGKEDIYAYGKDAVRGLIFKLPDLYEWGEKSLLEKFIEVDFQLKLYGFMTTKEYLKSYLQKNEFRQSLVEEVEHFILQWKKLSLYLVKIGYTEDVKKIQEASDKMLSLTEQEESFYLKLYEQL